MIISITALSLTAPTFTRQYLKFAFQKVHPNQNWYGNPDFCIITETKDIHDVNLQGSVERTRVYELPCRKVQSLASPEHIVKALLKGPFFGLDLDSSEHDVV